MDTFNKVVTVASLACALLGLLLLAAIPDRIMAATAEAIVAVQPLVSATGGRLAVAGTALALCIGVAVLLYFELKPRSSREISVGSVEGGTAQVAASAVARQLERRLSEVPNVRGVSASVRQRREGVVAHIALDALSGTSVPEATSTTIALARRFLESEVGAKVAAVHVRVREVTDTEPLGTSPSAEASQARSEQTRVVPTVSVEQSTVAPNIEEEEEEPPKNGLGLEQGSGKSEGTPAPL